MKLQVHEVVTNELAVGPLGWLVDKSVLGHNSVSGKGISHANQKAGLVSLQKFGWITPHADHKPVVGKLLNER